MNSHPSNRDKIESITRADHKILAQAVASFRELFKGDRLPDADHELAEIQQLLKKMIADHFACEDTDLFPVLLANHSGTKTDELIAELKQEHVTLLDELHNVNALVGKRSLNKMTGEAWMALLNFFNHLQNHLTKEDQLLAGLR